MRRSPLRIALALLFVFVGFFGVTFAVVGAIIPLPVPAAGGTCGPGSSSESPISALVDPGSIGAGVKPSASQAAALQEWSAFVSECQSSTDHRMVAATVILVLSLVVGIAGPAVVLRRRRAPGPPPWSPYPAATPATGVMGPAPQASLSGPWGQPLPDR